MTIAGGVFVVLLAAFVYVGWQDGFFDVVGEWDGRTWLILIFAVMVTWISRNEFGSRGGGG